MTDVDNDATSPSNSAPDLRDISNPCSPSASEISQGITSPRTPTLSPVGPRASVLSTTSPVAGPIPGAQGGGAVGDSGALVLGVSAGAALGRYTTANSLIPTTTLEDALKVRQPGHAGLVSTFKSFSYLVAGSINHLAHEAKDVKKENSRLKEQNAELMAKASKQEEEISKVKEDAKLTKEAVEVVSSKVDNIGSSKFRENKIGCKVYPLLQRMIDGCVGIAGWVPVDHHTADGSLLKLVVMSVPVMKFLLVLHDKTLAEVDLDSFLVSTFARYEFPEFSNHKMDIKEFVKLLLKTPFKKYLVAPNSPTTQKNNLKNYIIMDQEYWRELLAAIRVEFEEEASGKLSDKAFVVPDGCMIQDWALTQVPRENPSSEGPSTYIDLLGRKLTEEERKACPPMNASWSREAYASMRGFFGIPEGGPKRHVQSGVYDPNNKKKVGTFAESFNDLHALAMEKVDLAKAKRKKSSKAPASAAKGKGKGKAPSSSIKGKGKAPFSSGKGKGKAPSSSTKGKGKAPSSPSKKKRPRSSQEDDEEVDVEGNTTKKKKKKKMKKSQSS